MKALFVTDRPEADRPAAVPGADIVSADECLTDHS